MTPTIGRMVIYVEGDFELGAAVAGKAIKDYRPDKIAEIGRHCGGTNGTREHPAIVTRVWTESCVNLCVFFDGLGPQPRSSVSLLAALPPGVRDESGASGWKWPERAADHPGRSTLIETDLRIPMPAGAGAPKE